MIGRATRVPPSAGNKNSAKKDAESKLSKPLRIVNQRRYYCCEKPTLHRSQERELNAGTRPGDSRVPFCFVFCAAAERSQSPDAAPGSFGGAANDGAVGEKAAWRPGSRGRGPADPDGVRACGITSAGNCGDCHSGRQLSASGQPPRRTASGQLAERHGIMAFVMRTLICFASFQRVELLFGC